MKVYLVRHGEACSEQEDPKRPINTKGKEEVNKIASFLQKLDGNIKTIYHSGKLRAQETADIIQRKCFAHLQTQMMEGLKPNDPVEPIASFLISSQEEEEEIMIVGHLPFLSRLACYLLCEKDLLFIGMDSAAVACIECTRGGVASLQWLVSPSIL